MRATIGTFFGSPVENAIPRRRVCECKLDPVRGRAMIRAPFPSHVLVCTNSEKSLGKTLSPAANHALVRGTRRSRNVRAINISELKPWQEIRRSHNSTLSCCDCWHIAGLGRSRQSKRSLLRHSRSGSTSSLGLTVYSPSRVTRRAT